MRHSAIVLALAAGCVPRPDDLPGGVYATEALAFGALIGQPSSTRYVELFNPGPGETVKLGPATLTGADAASFTIVRDECNRVMVSQDYCAVGVQFTGDGPEPREAELSIDAAFDGPLVTRLIGAGVAPAAFAAEMQLSADGAQPFVADLNLDGLLDIASGRDILIRTTNGTPLFTLLDDALPGYVLAVADVNGDGRSDLILDSPPTSLIVLPNETASAGASTPSFGSPVSFPAGPSGVVSIADFDGDTRLDIVRSGFSGGGVDLILNQSANGTPAFAAPLQIVQSAVTGLALGDFNNDDRIDLALGGGSSGQGSTDSRVAFNATSTPGQPVIDGEVVLPRAPNGDWRSQALATADLNRDGRRDVAYFVYDGLLVPMNTPDPTTSLGFRSPGYFTFGAFMSDLVTGDINGDSTPDIVATRENALVVILNATPMGNPLAALAEQGSLRGGTQASRAVIANLAGDAKLDVLVGSQVDQKLLLYIGQ